MRRIQLPRSPLKRVLLAGGLTALVGGAVVVSPYLNEPQQEGETASPQFSHSRVIPFKYSATYFHLTSEWQEQVKDAFLLQGESTRAPLPSEIKEFEGGLLSALRDHPELFDIDGLNAILRHYNGHIPAKIETVRVAQAVELLPRVPDRFLKKSRELLSYFAEFIDEPDLKQIPIIVPQHVEQMEQPGHNIYILGRYVGFIQTDVFYIEGFPNYQLPPFTINQDAAGVLDTHVEDKRLIPRHLYIDYSMKKKVVKGYDPTIIGETGHFVFNRRTQRLVQEAFEEDRYSSAVIDTLMHEEEVFTHAVEAVVLNMFFRECGITPPRGYFDGFTGYDVKVPHYQKLDEMYRRLQLQQHPGESLDEFVGRQRQSLLGQKERYFSGDETMFLFLK